MTMTIELDPFELFALVNPFTDIGVDDAGDELLATIMATPLVPQPKQHRRRPWIIGGAVVVAVVATAAFAFIRREHSDDPNGIVCYSTGELDSNDRSVVTSEADPIAACEFLWTNGTYGDAGPPPLVACVNDGVVSVFPGGPSLCSRLGLADFAPGGSSDQLKAAELNERSLEIFRAQCYPQAEALTRARELLDEIGLDDWTVQLAEEFPPGTECGAPTVLVDAKQLLIFGVERRD
jgi:hypothetical protein